MKQEKVVKKIFVFAGEVSADLCGGRVIRKLKAKTAPFELIGVGGPALSAAGLQEILPMKAFQIMGFSDVIKKLPQVLKNFHTVKRAIIQSQPDLVLFIDQPAFSMRMAPLLRKKGYTGKIVQLVAPTVWAYKPERALEMARSFDLLLTLFDFEPDYFSHTGLKTLFVGHPILESIEEAKSLPETLHFSKPVLSIFPGSRPDEIRRNLPKQLEAARIIQKKMPEFQIVVSGRDVPFDARYELMRKSRAAIAKCGTVTLELALHSVPTVVTYELSLLNRIMAKYFLQLGKLPYYSIANIVAGQEILPECIRPPVSPSSIAAALLEHLETPFDASFLQKKLQTTTCPTLCPSTFIASQLSALL